MSSLVASQKSFTYRIFKTTLNVDIQYIYGYYQSKQLYFGHIWGQSYVTHSCHHHVCGTFQYRTDYAVWLVNALSAVISPRYRLICIMLFDQQNGIKTFITVYRKFEKKNAQIQQTSLKSFKWENLGSIKCPFLLSGLITLNSLWPGDAILWHRFGSTSAQVIGCCLMVWCYYLKQCWLIINGFL